MIRGIFSIIFVTALCSLTINTTLACSVCHCGDNAFLFSDRGFALPDHSVNHRYSFTLGNLYSSKSNVLAADEGPGIERQREFRPSARLSYNLLYNMAISLEAPFQYRRIVTSTFDGTSREHSAGIGDAGITAVYMRNLWDGIGQFFTGGLSLAVIIPTGNNNMHLAGERLDEHLQAGTGAVDWQVGGAASRVTCASRYFASLYYRHNGTNDFAYHYGNAGLFNFGGLWPISDRIAGSLQINSRYAGRDLDHGLVADDTGGWMAYLTPGFKLDLTEAMGISMAVQLPVYRKLYGIQSEKAVFSSGISVAF